MKLDLTLYPPQEVEQVFGWVLLTQDILKADVELREQLTNAVQQLAYDCTLNYPKDRAEVANGSIAATIEAMLAEEMHQEEANGWVSLTVVVLFAGADGPAVTASSLCGTVNTMADDIERSDV